MTTQNTPTTYDDNYFIKEFGFTKNQFDVIRRMYLDKIKDDEIKVFCYVCKQTGLNPMLKQIYAVPRNGKMTIQTAIDGYRLIAERTGKYSPGRDSTFMYDKEGNVHSATAYIKKMTPDGTWHEVSATAFTREYNPGVGPFWQKMPHTMISKCAEALALRKAFPAELSAVYTKEEMDQDTDKDDLKQAECEDITARYIPQPESPATPPIPDPAPVPAQKITEEHAADLLNKISAIPAKEALKIYDWAEQFYKTRNLSEIPEIMYASVSASIERARIANLSTQVVK